MTFCLKFGSKYILGRTIFTLFNCTGHEQQLEDMASAAAVAAATKAGIDISEKVFDMAFGKIQSSDVSITAVKV